MSVKQCLHDFKSEGDKSHNEGSLAASGISQIFDFRSPRSAKVTTVRGGVLGFAKEEELFNYFPCWSATSMTIGLHHSPSVLVCHSCLLGSNISLNEGSSKQSKKFAKQRFAQMKKMISAKDPRVVEKKLENNPKLKARLEKEKQKKADTHRAPQYSSALFFQYNSQLGPPFHVIIDTNFVNFSIKFKMDIIQSMMDCLYAKCTPYITDCVMAEMEKLGRKYRVALRIMKDGRYERLPCLHPGTYADDCIVQRVTQHKCYIVATNDKDLKRRIRKIPGVPIMYIKQHRYTIERMPDAYGAPRE